jgi:hypothetical protein
VDRGRRTFPILAVIFVSFICNVFRLEVFQFHWQSEFPRAWLKPSGTNLNSSVIWRILENISLYFSYSSIIHCELLLKLCNNLQLIIQSSRNYFLCSQHQIAYQTLPVKSERNVEMKHIFTYIHSSTIIFLDKTCLLYIQITLQSFSWSSEFLPGKVSDTMDVWRNEYSL